MNLTAKSLELVARTKILADYIEEKFGGIAFDYCGHDRFTAASHLAEVSAYLATSAGVTEEQTPRTLDVDALAQEIRRVDGNHSLGAGQLAEALLPFLDASRVAPVSQKEAGKYCTCANSVTSDPCIVCGKPKFITREWFERRAAAEGDLEIGAGSPAPAPAGEPAVKALEWQERYQTNADGESEVIGWLATTGFGAPYRVWIDDFNVKGWQLSYGAVIGNFDTPEAAKAAAQADYETRIRSALHTSPTPVSAPVGVVEQIDDLVESLRTIGCKVADNGQEWAEHSIEVVCLKLEALAALRSPAVVEGK